MFTLDTNACVHLLNGSSPALIRRIRAHTPRHIRISSVVRAELMQGARLSSRVAENLRSIERLLEPFHSIPFDDSCADQYAQISSTLRRQGMLIGANDLLIAATALSRKLTLVTHNVDEFSRVTGLLIEDWEE